MSIQDKMNNKDCIRNGYFRICPKVIDLREIHGTYEGIYCDTASGACKVYKDNNKQHDLYKHSTGHINSN